MFNFENKKIAKNNFCLICYQEGGSDVDKRPQNTHETSKVDKRKTERNHEDFWMQNQLQENRTQSSQPQTIHEHQLKASRDVRWQMCCCTSICDYLNTLLLPLK